MHEDEHRRPFGVRVAGDTAPRHPGVVPGAIADLVMTEVPIGGTTINPEHLLKWPWAGRPTDAECDQAVWVIINRLRARRVQISNIVLRFAPVLSDSSLLSSDDQRRARLLREQVGGDGVFTFGEVKPVLKLEVIGATRFLARLDAAGWLRPVDGHTKPLPGVGVESTGSKGRRPARGTLGRLLCEDELSADLVARVSTLPWLDAVNSKDIRLWNDEEDGVAGAVARSLEAGPDSKEASLTRAAARMETNTFAQEVRDIATCLVGMRRRDAGSEAQQRWVEIFVHRYVSKDGPGRTLEEVGSKFGLTRERVRQICANMHDVREGLSACLPATRRVLDAAKRIAPNPVEEMNAQLVRMLGEGAGIEAALNFAAEMGMEGIPIERREAPLRVATGYVWLPQIEVASENSWAKIALRVARRDITMLACTSLLRVAGWLALDHEIAPGREALRALVERAPGFRWLDQEGGWFTFGDAELESSAAARIRKIMAVARRPVNVDDIATALVTDDMWLARERAQSGAIPPLHVLRELLAGWDWLRTLQRNRFTPLMPIPMDVLSDPERMFVEIIDANGGVAARHQLVPVITKTLSITDIAVNAAIGSSPIVVKFEHGLYGLLGREPNDGALETARQRLRDRHAGATSPEGPPRKGFKLRVTEAAMRREQYPVPERFKSALRPGALKVRGSEVELWVSGSYVIRRLRLLYPDAQPGDAFWVEVEEEGCVAVEHLKGAVAGGGASGMGGSDAAEQSGGQLDGAPLGIETLAEQRNRACQ